MNDHDEFFLPEEVDRQIESMSQFKEGDRIDAEALAYLRSFYQADAQKEQATLDRIWNRIAGATLFEQDTQENEKDLTMQNPQIQYSSIGTSRGSHPRRTLLMQRLGLLAAAVFLVALVGSMAFVFYAAPHNNIGTGSPKLSTARVPMKVTSVSMYGSYC